MHSAFLIVDVQVDFCPGGALGVKDGDKVVPIINALSGQFEFVFASKDWHPATTVHFETWPPHCIRATKGSQFHPDLDITGLTQILLKGTGNSDDGYSAFEATNLDFYATLQQLEVDTLYIAGLTTEYCIRSSALDAARCGFNTFVIEDAIRPVERQPGDADNAWREMLKAGITRVSSANLLASL